MPPQAKVFRGEIYVILATGRRSARGHLVFYGGPTSVPTSLPTQIFVVIEAVLRTILRLGVEN